MAKRNHREIRVFQVTQEHALGCGVACVASLLSLPYKKALAFFDDPTKAWTTGYHCRDLVSALHVAGRSFRHKYVKNRRDPVLRNLGTIVFTKKSTKYPQGHYLIRAEQGWMNPWSNFPEIAPARSAFVPRLPGVPIYAVYEVNAIAT